MVSPTYTRQDKSVLLRAWERAHAVADADVPPPFVIPETSQLLFLNWEGVFEIA